MAAGGLDLPVVDLASPDLRSAAEAVRKACVEIGFFYATNHGIQDELLDAVFADSNKFFDQPLEQKMLLKRSSAQRGYTPPYTEKLDAASGFQGDLKESFDIGPLGGVDTPNDPIQWPPKESFPSWKDTMKLYHATARAAGKMILSLIAMSLDLDADFFQNIGAFDRPSAVIRLLHYSGKMILSLIAMSLDLDADFFQNIGAFDRPSAVIRLLHYSGEVNDSDKGNYGASAHSDYGMITLLATDGTPGLQICREKDKHPQLWEDVHHIEGTLIVNIGDLLERWTNCVFRSTIHRVVTVGKERYSAAYFLNPNPDLVVHCLESCCCEAYPPRFLPITAGDYLKERLSAIYE